MADNTHLRNIMLHKVYSNPHFMGWYLTCFMQNKGWNEDDLIAFLQADGEKLFQLAMCKTPESGSHEFAKELNKIATFTNISIFSIASLIREVDSINTMKDNPQSTASLMAARHRKDQSDESK
jgi:hypothetical protein